MGIEAAFLTGRFGGMFLWHGLDGQLFRAGPVPMTKRWLQAFISRSQNSVLLKYFAFLSRFPP